MSTGVVDTGLRWNRVHPVTPAVKGWKVLAVLLAIAAQQVGTSLSSAQDMVGKVGWGPVVAVAAAALVIGFAYAAIAWRMTRYAIDAEAVYLQTGVLFRQQRTARLDRVQAIDLVQPLLARILGLAELKIEVAGGTDSAVRLSYLKEDAAQRLRNELLARAAGVEFGTQEQPEAPVAPERELISVSPGRLIGSLVRSVTVVVLLLGLVAVVVVVVVSREFGAVFGLLPAVLGAGGYLWQRFAGEFGFRAAQSPDGIRLRHGLLEARSQTLPPGRVQAVRISQAVLWRGKDWWRVQINVAGYGQADQQQTESVLLPVGDRDEALLALWLVLPDLGSADPRALLDDALSGAGDSGSFVTSPRRARWLDPLAWRRNGYALTGRALLVRRGRFLRELVVVPHERTQSIGLRQGPLQRRLGLASVVLHSTPGPVRPTVVHLDAAAAGALLGEQAARARTARASAGPERWMQELRTGPGRVATGSQAASS
ncbi:PH domain-containing protein [Cellulomonas sp. KRMCY2]|uniref:PH domain-containing protein n=1 Tax=Cellulomonas sp. KRMCY2 TaxID=1304865 RepID=UPI00045E8953|nr:PH domain-containing protein [Cellulomonas sp. KRMCY2]